MPDLYLRDLNPELRLIEEKAIRKSEDKELIDALDKEKDIIIGIITDRDAYIPVDWC